MPIHGAVRTDIGKVRSNNEDAFGFFPDVELYVVADGMGGHVGGEIASALVVEAMRLSLQNTRQEDLTPVLNAEGVCSVGARRLLIAVQHANSKVCDMIRQDPRLAGMGTTVAAVLFGDQGNLASICHVGDSRVYRIRAGRIEQLTEDHSLVQQLIREGKLNPQQAETAPHRHILTQAVGMGLLIQPAIRLEMLQPGDLFLLCSDGVHGAVAEEELLGIAGRAEVDLQHACDTLVDLANARGGRDNSTLIMLQYESSEGGTGSTGDRRTR